MNLGLRELAEFLGRHKQDNSLVLATVTATEGSSYRKPGAMMLVRENHEFAGLISGGCLEGDLIEHATAVFGDGKPRELVYDLSSEDDVILGLGLGCGGVVRLLLQRLERDDGFGVLSPLFDSMARRSSCVLALVHKKAGNLATGTWALANGIGGLHGDSRLAAALEGLPGAWNTTLRYRYSGQQDSVLLVRIEPSPRVLVCGAGPDAVPVARQIDGLGWECVVVDHRGGYARAERFPATTEVIQLQPSQLNELLDLGGIDAAIVMSHNLEHDETYLRQLAGEKMTYIGLLGPKARRDELQEKLGIGGTLIHGPAGFDIGAELPESIALSIVAEVHAVLSATGAPGDAED